MYYPLGYKIPSEWYQVEKSGGSAIPLWDPIQLLIYISIKKLFALCGPRKMIQRSLRAIFAKQSRLSIKEGE